MLLSALNHYWLPDLVALDGAGFHKTNVVHALLKRNNLTSSKIHVISISTLEKLDVVVNQSFKHMIHETTKRWLHLIEEQEKRRTIWNSSSFSKQRVVIQNAVAETCPLFCSTHYHSIINFFRNNVIALPVDGSCDANISTSTFRPFVIGNDLEEIQPNGSECPRNNNTAPAFPPHDPLTVEQQFHQEADKRQDLFDLFQTAEHDFELEPDVIDIESNNLLKFNASLEVSNNRKSLLSRCLEAAGLGSGFLTQQETLRKPKAPVRGANMCSCIWIGCSSVAGWWL